MHHCHSNFGDDHTSFAAYLWALSGLLTLYGFDLLAWYAPLVPSAADITVTCMSIQQQEAEPSVIMHCLRLHVCPYTSAAGMAQMPAITSSKQQMNPAVMGCRWLNTADIPGHASCSCCTRFRRAWFGTTLHVSGGSGCLLSGSTSGLAASHCSRASRSKLWPSLPYSTGSRMTLPLSGQRHQSGTVDCCAAGNAALGTSVATFGATWGAAAAAAASGTSGTAGLAEVASAAWGSAWLPGAAAGVAALPAACALSAAAAACCLAVLFRARLEAALLGCPKASDDCSSACSRQRVTIYQADRMSVRD